MQPAVLCGVFLPEDAGGEPLLLGLASDAGPSEVHLRTRAPAPDALLQAHLISPAVLRSAMAPSEGISGLLARLEPGETVLLHAVPPRARLTLRGIRPDLQFADLASAVRLAWPTVGEGDLAGLAQRLGLPSPAAPRPEHHAALLREALPDLEERLRYALPVALLREIQELATELEWPSLPRYRDLLAQATASRSLSARKADLAGALMTHDKPERPTRPDADLGTRPVSVARVLGPGGLVSRSHPTYEERPHQLRMADQVAEAIANDEVLLVEAGTGVGKSLAYLVPLALHALTTGERVLISTATKTLQDQLISKDVPLFLEATGLDLRVTVMKGRRNYLCLGRLLARYEEGRGLLFTEDRRGLLPLLAWAAQSATLDFAELPVDPDSDGWARLQDLAADPEQCLRSACPRRRSCAVQRMRERAQASDIVVVNHALFFSAGDAPLLPETPRCVFDEAHTLEDVATEHSTLSVSHERFERALSALRGAAEGASLLDLIDEALRQAGDEAQDAALLREEAEEQLAAATDALPRFDYAATALSRRLERAKGGPRIRLDEEDFGGSEGAAVRDAGQAITTALEALGELLGQLASEVPLLEAPDMPQEVQQNLARELVATADRLKQCARESDAVLALEAPDSVFFLEREGRGCVFRAAPIDAARVIADRILERHRTVVLTSATLAVGGDMSWAVRRLGAQYASERLVTSVLPSEFDFATQALALVPSDMPDPNAEGWLEAVSDAVVRLTRASRGSALVLFTSRQHLDQAYERAAPSLREDGIPVYCQSRPGLATELRRVFAREVDSVLFATRSFFEGVDVPGPALESVILTRLPFAVPTDPIVEARWRRVEEQGRNPMLEYYLPMAILSFRQAMGRLIRSRSDRGCMILLDSRALRKSYGRQFLEALPGCPVVRRPLDEVVARVRQWFADP